MSESLDTRTETLERLSPQQDYTPEPAQFTAIEERVIALLGQGVKPSIVAEACSISPEYVSTISERPECAIAIATFRAEKLESAVAVDSTIESLEALALERMANQIGFTKNAVETARVFSILNAAKKKSEKIGNAATGDGQTPMVTIIMPSASRDVSIRLNSANQVLEVDGTSLVPMPSRALQGLRKQAKESATVVIPAPVPTAAANADDQRAKDIRADLVTHIGGVRKVL